MCVRLLVAVVFTVSILSVTNSQTLDYHEEDSESVRAREREIQQTVGESEREVHEQERERLAALEAELEEELKLSRAAKQDEESLGAIPGLAGQDYPAYTTVPRTSFTCANKLIPGYYADVEARCQVFHICDASGAKHSFLCPLGSLFNQKYLVCDWWYTSECDPADTHRQVYQHDFNRLDVKQNNQQPELEQHSNFVSENDFYSAGEENYILLQPDIFHSAETGVPNRNRYESSKESRKNNSEHIKKSGEDQSNRNTDFNVGNSTNQSEIIARSNQKTQLS